jgi:hypothetical protein
MTTKCSICGKEISASQIKYGDASGTIRDENGKITMRAFHHECVLQQEETDELKEKAKNAN